jgi:hypothetical protein
MSQGPIIVSGPPGQMSSRKYDNGPDVYGLAEKWDVLNALHGLDLIYRRDCSCKGEQHDYMCPDPEGSRPVSIEAAREALKPFRPEWQEVLTILETDPDAFIVVR